MASGETSVEPLGTRSRSPCVCLVGLWLGINPTIHVFDWRGNLLWGFFWRKTTEMQEEAVNLLQTPGTGTQAPGCREVTTLAAPLAGEVTEKWVCNRCVASNTMELCVAFVFVSRSRAFSSSPASHILSSAPFLGFLLLLLESVQRWTDYSIIAGKFRLLSDIWWYINGPSFSKLCVCVCVCTHTLVCVSSLSLREGNCTFRHYLKRFLCQWWSMCGLMYILARWIFGWVLLRPLQSHYPPLHRVECAAICVRGDKAIF